MTEVRSTRSTSSSLVPSAASDVPAPSPTSLVAIARRSLAAEASGDRASSTIAASIETGRSRRAFLRGSFVAMLGASLAGSAGMLLDFLWPHHVRAEGGPVVVGQVADFPPARDPVLIRGEREFWLVNLDPAETRPGGSGGAVGLLALWRKCPHLGCAVPWVPRFNFVGDDGGWFRCPCHSSTYTKAGVRVYGPAPRSMDTMLITVDAAGAITVDTSQIRAGGEDNPGRAVKFEPGSTS